ncbi:MAG: alpha/beta hydrolase-fold protein [Bacteroidales bacterium]|nr:alpha/beta hydrolase-fold protein [Bacteroidales bacterium]
MDRAFSIYLPAGYNENNRSYPVLYLLHGGGVITQPGFSQVRFRH